MWDFENLIRAIERTFLVLVIMLALSVVLAITFFVLWLRS